MLDLDQARKDRAAKRAEAAAHEGAADGQPIIFGGREIAVLPPELPFDVLRPLEQVNDEIALLLGQAVRMQNGNQGIEAAQLVLDLLASNAQLPQTLVKVAKEIASALLGDGGLAAFMDARPTLPDIAALVGGIFNFYRVSLGESSRSDASSESAGPNSEPTSSASTGSMPAASSEPLALPASSE